MKRSNFVFFILIGVTALFNISSCSNHSFTHSLKGTEATHIADISYSQNKKVKQESKEDAVRLQTDLKRLNAFSSELEAMKAEMFEMRKRSQIWDLDYFPPEEHDKIENLLFRYLVLRKSLWEIINYYKDYRDHFSDTETQTKGFIIGYSAGLHLISYSSLLVATFMDEPAGKSKLNEAYPRSEIPEGTYDMLFSSVTSVEHLEAIKVAWVLFSDEREDTTSPLFKIYESDKEYRSVVDKFQEIYKESESRIGFILEKKSPLFPEMTNRLRHTMIAKLAQEAKNTLDDNLYTIRGLLFTNISDIKFPMNEPLSFSSKQKVLIHSLLKPGDIILTFTAGYMSNIFLPGKFKHGITYIGTPAQREQVKIKSEPSTIITGINNQKYLENISYARLESGHQADVIEAVAEGVIFNSLDILLDTHINRMVVLRPRLSEEDKREALLIVFSLLGNDYDFKFDFNDGSYQCCTEVIYRALNSRGAFNFKLINRMGALTLSADDILNYHFSMEPRPFDVVLYAEKAPKSKENNAKIYTGEKGITQLKKLMDSPSILPN